MSAVTVQGSGPCAGDEKAHSLPWGFITGPAGGPGAQPRPHRVQCVQVLSCAPRLFVVQWKGTPAFTDFMVRLWSSLWRVGFAVQYLKLPAHIKRYMSVQENDLVILISWTLIFIRLSS